MQILMSLLMMTTYLGIGKDFSRDNIINIAGFLFFWCAIPAFGAVSYVPSLVLGKWLGPSWGQLLCRTTWHNPCHNPLP
jgi:hypothetical protein